MDCLPDDDVELTLGEKCPRVSSKLTDPHSFWFYFNDRKLVGPPFREQIRLPTRPPERDHQTSVKLIGGITPSQLVVKSASAWFRPDYIVNTGEQPLRWLWQCDKR
jgi:hypothetical protein